MDGLVGSLILKILVIGAILRSFHHPKDLTFEKIHLSPRNPDGAYLSKTIPDKAHNFNFI
ncbi:hypothetical protein ACB098_06G074300 [Castanea mollissima]